MYLSSVRWSRARLDKRVNYNKSKTVLNIWIFNLSVIICLHTCDNNQDKAISFVS